MSASGTMDESPNGSPSDVATVPTAHARRGVHSPWGALPLAGRVALLGVLVSALVAIALGVYIPLEIRRHLLDAEGRGLQAAVAALQPALPRLDGHPFDPADIELLDRLVDRTLLDADHVRAKLWSLDGVILYSDAHELIGQSFPDVRARLQEVMATGVLAEVTELEDPENVLERTYGRLVEFYVPVQNENGRTEAIFEIYSNVRFFEEALGGISRATWLAIGSGLTVLLVFLVVLVTAALRSMNRDRAQAEARAAELAVLVGAAEALASSLVPAEFFARLQSRVRAALALSRLAIESQRPQDAAAVAHQLRDGSWLVAARGTAPLADEDVRVLRSVANNLDAALANAALYAEVREAAQTRRTLLRKVVEAHEDERRHIVGELHDSLAGDLIRTLYGIRGIAARTDDLNDEVHAELVALERVVAEAEADLRAFMARVQPASLDEFGLKAALEERVDRFRRESHLDVEFSVRGQLDRYSKEVQIVCLRAAEEALLNVRKHANASRVRVAVTANKDRIRLAVDDDGVGWADQTPTEGRGLGLDYMRERVVGFGGTVQTEASRLGGARLVLTIGRDADP